MEAVSLKEIADRLDCFIDGFNYYLNKKTGEIIETQMEYFSIAEESEEDDDFSEYQDWEQEAIKDALVIVDNWEDFIELPDSSEVNEYEIMESFCYSQGDEKLRSILCQAIDGKGAFRRFKDAIFHHGLENEWDRYKYDSLCGIAREWCEFTEVPYKE